MANTKTTLNIEKEGEKLTFHSEPDCTAPFVEFDCVFTPGAKGPGFHVHPKQTETFYVVSGKMIGRIKGQKDKVLGPGETFVVPPGVIHNFSNGSKDQPLETRITLEPALHFQWFMIEAAKVAIHEKSSRNDISLLPEMAYIMWQCRDEQRIGGMPVFVENMLIGTLAFIARITGKAKKIAPKIP
ncbi:MAG: cupin domain-containing protein [Cyclobacteriaceae bacterium]|nr:cupin domain-containing protein [Cyclobacteriaceae bacterium]